MKENNSYFIICRAGRQIDIVRDTNYQSEKDNITIVNYDRNWVCELHFEPVLDELFGITTNKQQVEIDDYLWDVFAARSLPVEIRALRRRFKELIVKEDADKERAKEDRPSEKIMEETAKYQKAKVPEDKKEKGQAKLKEEAQRDAKEQNKDPEQMLADYERESESKKYKVDFTNYPGAPFYEPTLWGQQIRIKINTAHRFFQDIYSQQEPRGKTALELLLFAIGGCEVEAEGEKQLFYENERYEWSRRLELRLSVLDQKDPIQDKLSLVEEEK